MFDAAKLAADLERDEGFRSAVYDDATGGPIVPGTHVQGHPTVGFGRALDVNPLTIDEARALLANDIATTTAALFSELPWARDLDEVRCRALVNMAFNLGVAGLLTFHNMLRALQQGAWQSAARHALQSKWASQVGVRAMRIAKMLETGADDGGLIA